MQNGFSSKKSEHPHQAALMCDNSTYQPNGHTGTRKNQCPAASIQDWQKIYSILGLMLKVEMLVACAWRGNLRSRNQANQETSKTIIDLFMERKK